MGKNKNGFTLIELLAVIVILAIIALIAVPLILNVIDDSKKGAFKSSAYGILGAAEFEYTQSILKGNKQTVTFTYTDGIELSDIEGISLKYKGTKPRNGTVSVNGLGKIALAIHDGKYCAEKDFDSSEVIISEKKVEECQISGDNEAPATPKFLKNFGGMGDDKFFSVINANDGYVTIGSTTSSDVDLLGIYRGQADAIIVKYDTFSDVVWKKTFGGTLSDYFIEIIAVNDGYIVVGSSDSTTEELQGLNKGYIDAIIVKYDLNGNIVWNKNFGGNDYDYFYNVITTNNGYVSIGYSKSKNGDLDGLNIGEADGIIVKYDFNGNIVWNKNFGGSGYEEFYDIAMVNKGYVIVGYSKSKTGDWEGLNRGNYDAIIAKIDLNGNK